MKILKLILVGILIATTQLSMADHGTEHWSLKADYVDACSCDLTCPCIHGGASTHGYCKGVTLVEINEGHFGDVDLSGVTVLAVYNGGAWIKFFVDETASREQTEAVVELLPTAEGFFEAPITDFENATVHVNRKDETITIETNGTIVEIEMVKGFHGEPIMTEGLPAQGFPGLPYLEHTQYKTITLSHKGEHDSFSVSGTNGFTARVEASEHSTGPVNTKMALMNAKSHGKDSSGNHMLAKESSEEFCDHMEQAGDHEKHFQITSNLHALVH